MTRSTGAAVALQAIIFGISHGYEGWKATIIATAYGLVFGIWPGGSVTCGPVLWRTPPLTCSLG